MKQTIEGIVLNETNYGETSKILNVLTKEYGYISIISKGSRTLKSKLRGISMKFIYANFTISYKEKGISILHEGNVINSLKNIVTNFEKINYITYIFELFKNILKDTNQKELFSILKDTLLKINDNLDAKILTNIVEIKLLTYLGVKPNFLECVICGCEDIITYDIDLSGSVCKNCYQDTYIFKKDTIKLLKLFQNIDISKITKLNVSSEKTKEELDMFIETYYEKYTGIYMLQRKKVLSVKNKI